MSTYVAPKSMVLAQKQAGAVADSELVEAQDNHEFATVEQKKGRANEEGGFRRRQNQFASHSTHMAKLQNQHAEDKKKNMTGPQMSRKRMKWQQS